MRQLAVNKSSADRVPSTCQACIVREQGICAALNGEELLHLSRNSQRRVVESGHCITRFVGDSDTLSNIMSGAVRLTKHLQNGRHQIVALQFASALVGRPFEPDDTIEASAAGVVRLCSVRRTVFKTLLESNAAFEHKVLEQAVAQLDEARSLLMSLGRKSALERVASFIKMVVEQDALDCAPYLGWVTMPMNRGEMSDFLGLTRETISRKMTDLRRLRIIEFENALSVRILSHSRLNGVSGERIDTGLSRP